MLQDQGDLEGALKEYRKALEIKEREAPNSLTVATSYDNIGSVLKGQDDLERELKEYRKCLDILLDRSRIVLVAFHPLLAICRYNLGEMLAGFKEYEEARKLATDILDVLPDYKWAYLLLGRALIGLGRIPEAIDSYDEAISRSPNFGDAHATKVEAEVGLRLSQTPGEEGKEEGKADLDLMLKQTVIAALSSDPDRADPVDESLQGKLSSRELTVVEWKPTEKTKTNAELQDVVERMLNRMDHLEIENADLKKIVTQQGLVQLGQGLHIDHLRPDVDELTQELQTIRKTVDRAMELCSGADEESAKKLKDIDENLNRRDHVEVILTEWESLIITVAKAVKSGRIDLDAELPATIGYACYAAKLVALAPVADATKIAATFAMGIPFDAVKGIQVALAMHTRVHRRMKFEEIARVASTLTLTNDCADMLILLLALEWSDMHETTVVELPSWSSELGQELRKDLLDSWRWICGSVKKLALEKVREGCIKLIEIVGFVE